MQLSLVKITHRATGKVTYYAVNDKHYDAMLACGGSSLEDEYLWEWIGDVEVSQEVLNEQGYFHKDDEPGNAGERDIGLHGVLTQGELRSSCNPEWESA